MGLKFFLAGAQDIKSSLRGAKLPNGQALNDDKIMMMIMIMIGQPMLLDEEQNSLALLIEQVTCLY